MESALGRRRDHILRQNKEEDFDTAGSEIYIGATRHFAIAGTRQIEDVEICLGCRPGGWRQVRKYKGPQNCGREQLG